MPGFLTLNPNYDDATYYLKGWTLELIEEAKNRGIDQFPLDDERACRSTFEEMVAANKPSFILINGHGTGKEIYGQGKITQTVDGRQISDDTVLKIGENEAVTSNCIVYARACYSSVELAEACTKKGGAKAYIGYKDKFVFMIDPNKMSRIKQDKTATYFKTISNIIASTILKGHVVSEAVTRSKQQTIKIIEQLETSEFNTQEAQSILPFLFYDLIILEWKGDGEARM